MTSPEPTTTADEWTLAMQVELEAARAQIIELEEARAVWERWAKEMERRLALAERALEDQAKVIEAARFADNCIDEGDSVATHCSGGACLYELHWAIKRLDESQTKETAS